MTESFLSPTPEMPSPQQLFEKNQGLVYDFLKKHPIFLNGYESDDLTQEAMAIYWEACLSYDLQKGSKFSTYVWSCLRNHFNYLIRRDTKQIRPIDSVEILIEHGRI